MSERSDGPVATRSWLREPLLHFLALGVGLFVLFRLASGPGTPGQDEIVVTAGRIDTIVEIFSKLRQRPPSPAELEGLIEEHILEEVLYREALAMGLDTDDTIIRRRLRQKLEFLVDDFAAAEPTDEQLRALMEDSPERFREETTVSFSHIFFQEGADNAAAALLAELHAGAEIDVSMAGDPLPLPSALDAAPEGDVDALFGQTFKTDLRALDIGVWTGPVVSPYGVHLVRVTERIEGEVPALSEIRETVVREWLAARRQTAQETFFDQLRSQYVISVEFSEWVGESAGDFATAESTQ